MIFIDDGRASIGIADCLVAATAVAGLELATLDVTNFAMCEGLRAPFAQ